MNISATKTCLLLYTCNDDGLVQVSDDGGATWRRAVAFPGVPELSFVNRALASLHDPDTVFAATGLFLDRRL